MPDTSVREPRWYLSAAAVGVMLMLAADSLVPGSALATVYVADALAAAVLLGVLVLWIRCRSTARLGRAQLVFIVAAMATWATSFVQYLTSTVVIAMAPLVLGVLLILVLLKPPSAPDASTAMDVAAWALVAACTIVLVLEVTGLEPSWYDDRGLVDLQAMERGMYAMPLADVFGLDGRWAGPFDHPGRAGVAGALLLVWGLARTGVRRVAFTVAGALTVVLAASSTGLLAAAVGVVVLVLARMVGRRSDSRARLSGAPAAVVVIAAIAVLGLVVVLVVGPNPGLTGRTSVWPVYLSLWREAPWFGIGDSAIVAARADGVLPSWAYHAHNSWIDLLARRGLIALTGSAVAVGAALVATLSAGMRGRGAPAALVTALVIASVTQPVIAWLVATPFALVLTLAVLMAGRSGLQESPPPVRSEQNRT